MRYAEYPPSPALERLVERFWFLEGAASGVADAILPDGRMEIVFHYAGTFWRHDAEAAGGGDPGEIATGVASVADAALVAKGVANGTGHTPRAVRQPDAMVVGQMLAPVLVAPVGHVGVAAARLRPAAARALFGFASSEIASRCLDLDLLFTSARALRDHLAEASDDAARIGLLERWLLTHARGEPARSIEAVVREVTLSGGRASIDALADACGLHVRQLERQFLRDVGLTPKTFARVSRLQRALDDVRAGTPLALVALDCGFYDQAHMARDFRELTAMSPRAWKAHVGELAPLFVSGMRE